MFRLGEARVQITLIPIRPEDIQLASDLLFEASEWAPRTPVNMDPAPILFASNSVWLTAINEDKEVVGIAGVHGISFPDRSGELACGVVPKWRGAGMAKTLADLLHDYCFKTLNLHRLTSTCLQDSPMAKVAFACNLVLEGRGCHSRFKNGEWLDTLSFALLNPKEA